MKWYKQYFRVIVIGVIAFVLLMTTVASYINEGGNSWIGGGLERITSFIQEPLAKGERSIATAFKGIFGYKKLYQEKEELEVENEKLKQQILNQALDKHQLDELRGLADSLNYIDPSAEFEYIGASVIAMDGSSWYRIFTANVGSDKGVRKNSVVVNGDGLVGRVIDTGKGWSKVISVIDESNSVSFQILRDMELLGILKGNGSGKIEGYMLDETAAVIEGDLVITSGIGIYPQGIPIGEISKITRGTGGLLYKVEIEPSVDFNSIKKIGIVITEAQEEL